MFVYVLNQHGKPLMPCKPQKARKLLEAGKARVVSRVPFTIRLKYGSSGYVQPVIAGMDTGSKKVGCAAIANGEVIYQAEVTLRQDVSKKMKQRAMYRRTRRGRKTRYRPARWSNRASMRRAGRLAPSIQSKLESHLREKKQVEYILPVSEWKVETASFDIHKITNPEVTDYQGGSQKGFYNVKAYVLHRDNYKCQSGRKVKHADKLHVHHVRFRSNGGTDSPDNLTALCIDCHDALHAGKWELKAKRNKTKHATEVGIIKSRLKALWEFTETFGYETKFKREQVLRLPKSHANDAVAICCTDGEFIDTSNAVLYKRHVAAGDYQQTKGKHSEKRIPTGKLFGLRKFDLVKTSKGIGFVKGKRSSGYFAISDIGNNTIAASVNVKKDCIRLSARTTTTLRSGASSPS
ncbi:hypothetical protein LCGC14_0469010 [marine sediment metagenome]|uniref:HNH nuclease domain-containing protein n=1 Tax=marine sediment metagenome TaxID=412755 RepID=A0A0F9SCV5_9ZZZZ